MRGTVITGPLPPVETATRPPIGSTIVQLEFINDYGWQERKYTVAKYFKNHVLCIGPHGFSKCFTNWKFNQLVQGKQEVGSGHAKKGMPK